MEERIDEEPIEFAAGREIPVPRDRNGIEHDGPDEAADHARLKRNDRAGRSKNSTALIAELDAAFATRDSGDWRALFMTNGLVFEAVATMDQVANDPQMRTTEVLLPFEGDTMMTVNSPFFITGADKVPPRKPPELGEHNEQILREAGYDDDAISQLRENKAIG